MEGGAETPALFEVMMTHSLETKGTDWDALHALLRACVEEAALQVRGDPGRREPGAGRFHMSLGVLARCGAALETLLCPGRARWR